MSSKVMFFILVIFIFSCKSNSHKDLRTSISNKNIPENYVVLQGSDKQKSAEILIVVIDPHADGKLAVSEFNSFCEKNNCTVIGLTDVENGQTDFLTRIKTDIETAKIKLNLNVKKMFLVGFSGGARMAIQYATYYSNQVNGVLMCGAGTNQKQSLPFPLAMIVGSKDFNFIEQYYSPYSAEVLSENLLTLVFEGKHQWPSEEFINDAISYLFVKNGIFMPDIYNNLLKKAQESEKAKDYFLAFKYYEAAYKTCNNSQKDAIKSKMDKALNQTEYMVYFSKFEKNLQLELDRNNKLVTSIDQKDLSWWTQNIKDIDKESEQKDKMLADSYSRTKAFLGILMYSLTSKEINNQYSSKIDKYLQIYELLEPQNEDLQKFKDIRNSQKGN